MTVKLEPYKQTRVTRQALDHVESSDHSQLKGGQSLRRFAFWLIPFIKDQIRISIVMLWLGWS